MTGTTIYNATDGPLPIDRAGRQLAARDRAEVDDVTASPVSGHISSGRMVLIDTDEADDTTPTRTRKGRASTNAQEA